LVFLFNDTNIRRIGGIFIFYQYWVKYEIVYM